MKKTNSALLLRMTFSCIALTAAMLLGSFTANAQAVSMAGNQNPAAELAEKIGVQAYPMGTFDRQEVLDQLMARILLLRPVNNPSFDQQMKMVYSDLVTRDVQYYHMAPEISLIRSLTTVKEKLGSTPAQLRTLYNETIALFD